MRGEKPTHYLLFIQQNAFREIFWAAQIDIVGEGVVGLPCLLVEFIL
jgi:hypothetical protein